MMIIIIIIMIIIIIIIIIIIKYLDAELTYKFFIPFLIFDTRECMVSYTECEYTRLN